MADRLTPRGARFSRDMTLTVAVLAPDSWTEDVVYAVAQLLAWLTGDVWTLRTIASADTPREAPLDVADHSPVSLLSGGLDSFLGAIVLGSERGTPRFLGHKDSATSIRAAQGAVWDWLSKAFAPAPSYKRIELAQAGRRLEASSRSRAFMFMSLGVALAASTGSNQLVVPENGFTSINLPLRPNRGGALSTRSTHPDTFRRFGEILRELGIDVAITNPFEWLTKGEAMLHVRALLPPAGWEAAAGLTISCSKLGGNWFTGSPNLNCGLCVPCMVRRATFVRAETVDHSEYLFQSLTGSNLDRLVDARRGDIEAVKYAIQIGVDINGIDSGTWPADIDLDRVEDLVKRGLNELALLDLP
ncbi:queuosine biosynthesis protein queC [Naasia aerilata]|nr:queuosine biosynthesis protein queC [Naasia aerilata]